MYNWVTGILRSPFNRTDPWHVHNETEMQEVQ